MLFWNTVDVEDPILDASGLRSEFRNEKIELRESIELCCRESVRAGVTVTESNRLFHVSFVELVDNTIALDILDDEDSDFPLLSTCMVTYFHEGKAHLFLSMVRDFHTPAGDRSAQLFLRLPEQVAVSQIRWSFRVPMEGVSEFSIKLRDAQGRLHHPSCRDISFGGMKIEFSEYEDPAFEPGDICDMVMNYLGKEISLKAEVRHRKGMIYGLYLPQTFENGLFNPPDLYRWIVNALEQRCYRP